MKMTFGRNEKFKCSLLGYTEKEERRSQMEPGQWVQGANPTLMNGKSRGTGEARSPFKPIMGEHFLSRSSKYNSTCPYKLLGRVGSIQMS